MMGCRIIVSQSLLLGILILGQVMCYPTGAPDGACSSMMPSHGADPNNTLAPYTITTSKSTYRPNEEITVTLQGKSGESFKGFLIQPRKKSNVDHAFTVGTLIGNSSTKNPCTTPTVLAALTHTESSKKTTVTMTWKAPAEAVETVVFQATFVQEKIIYWVNVQSQELKPDSSGGVTTASFGVNWNPTLYTLFEIRHLLNLTFYTIHGEQLGIGADDIVSDEEIGYN